MTSKILDEKLDLPSRHYIPDIQFGLQQLEDFFPMSKLHKRLIFVLLLSIVIATISVITTLNFMRDDVQSARDENKAELRILKQEKAWFKWFHSEYAATLRYLTIRHSDWRHQ